MSGREVLAAPYAGGPLDRACRLRRDPAWLRSQATDAKAGLLRPRTSELTVVDGDELLETRLFTRADLRARREARGRLGNPDSIDRMLLEAWLEAGD